MNREVDILSLYKLKYDRLVRGVRRFQAGENIHPDRDLVEYLEDIGLPKSSLQYGGEMVSTGNQ